MTVDLGHVLARVGVRRAQKHGHGLVQRLAARAHRRAVGEPPPEQVRLGVGGAEGRAQYLFRARPAQAHDGDAALPRRGGDGGDGVPRVRHDEYPVRTGKTRCT